MTILYTCTLNSERKRTSCGQETGTQPCTWYCSVKHVHVWAPVMWKILNIIHKVNVILGKLRQRQGCRCRLSTHAKNNVQFHVFFTQLVSINMQGKFYHHCLIHKLQTDINWHIENNRTIFFILSKYTQRTVDHPVSPSCTAAWQLAVPLIRRSHITREAGGRSTVGRTACQKGTRAEFGSSSSSIHRKCKLQRYDKCTWRLPPNQKSVIWICT